MLRCLSKKLKKVDVVDNKALKCFCPMIEEELEAEIEREGQIIKQQLDAKKIINPSRILSS